MARTAFLHLRSVALRVLNNTKETCKKSSDNESGLAPADHCPNGPMRRQDRDKKRQDRLKKIRHKVGIRHPRLKDFAAALALGAALVSLSAGFATPAHAQEAMATLRGPITVEGGAPQVTAVAVNRGSTRTTPVAADGSYNFASLRPGTYRLEITTPSGVRRTDE